MLFILSQLRKNINVKGVRLCDLFHIKIADV